MFCVLSATRWKSPKLLACVSLILIQGIIEPTKNYVSNLADESWPRGLLNKTCNENSVFVDDEKFDTKRFKTRWTLVQLKNIYAVSFNKLPIFDPNAFYVFDRKKSCKNGPIFLRRFKLYMFSFTFGFMFANICFEKKSKQQDLCYV